jgi:hypothetical protein
MIIELRDGGVFDQNGRKIGGIVSINNSMDFGGVTRSEMQLIFDDWIDCTGFMRKYPQPSSKLDPKMKTNYKDKLKDVINS